VFHSIHRQIENPKKALALFAVFPAVLGQAGRSFFRVFNRMNYIILRRAVTAFILCCCLGLSGWAKATASDWQENAQVAVRLISGVNATGDLPVLPLGLEIKLAPEWKTYWRSPGDAGAPPSFTWPETENKNFAKAELLYPAPERHSLSGMETIGYSNRVVLPLQITPQHVGEAIALTANLTLLTCAELCIPNDFTLKLELPQGPATPTAEAELLRQATARIPQADGLTILAAQQSSVGEVTLEFIAPRALQRPEAFIETPLGGLFRAPQIILDQTDAKLGRMQFKPIAEKAQNAALPLTITLVDGDQAWDGTVELLPPSSAVSATLSTAASQPAPSGSLLMMLIFALLGGLILNLMPCVLPVLSLKLLKFMGHGGRDEIAARRSFLLAAAGIICSFLVLAALLLAARAAGATIGWGVQFQHPIFLLFLVVILLLFAANLWGWYEFALPAGLMQRLAVAGRHRKNWSDFLSGAFATLLATPCTAPFLGTAVGFALVADMQATLLIFLGMGFGMASPYLLVAALPSLATRMPRPGAWMVRLRVILGWALFATALWLGYVLSLQLGDSKASAATETSSGNPSTLVWQPFDRAQLAGHIAAGRVVFVDITAAWCLTCQVNKLTLKQSDLKPLLFNDKVIAMQADWTRPNAEIADYLRSFNRAGIPFNVIYGPQMPQGLVLPEILSVSAVRAALDKVQAAAATQAQPPPAE
jgi:suppressor for copper-sensitivity B